MECSRPTNVRAQPARVDFMPLAGTCHTHPATLLPCQLRAQTVRTCDPNHVCTGGERAQGAGSSDILFGSSMYVHGLCSQPVRWSISIFAIAFLCMCAPQAECVSRFVSQLWSLCCACKVAVCVVCWLSDNTCHLYENEVLPHTPHHAHDSIDL